MPFFGPFRGLRYSAGFDAASVTSPPYDVIDADERQALARRSPANAVHVDCPVGDADCYEQAGATLSGWVDDGTLVLDERPTFSIYRLSSTDEAGRARATTGVIGALGLEAPGTGDVLPHERTTPKARSDRLQLLRATEANLSAVWGLSLAGGLSGLLAVPDGPAAATMVDDEGVLHEVWPLDDPDRLAAIAAAVGSAPVVIADGHHRYETCLAYQAERVAAGVGTERGGSDATLAFVVELAEDQLTVAPIHRLLTDVRGGAADLVALLGGHFDAEVVEGRPGPDAVEVLVAAGALGLVDREDRWWLLRPRADAPAPERDLDSARLEAALVDTALETGGRPEVTYQHGVAEVLEALHAGRADAGVLLRPATVAQIAEVAHARDRMAPKTTFFWPKPRTGLVYRRFAD